MQQHLRQLGITQWRLRTSHALDVAADHDKPVAKLSEHWSTLAATVKDCRLCTLCQTRAQTVFGVGNVDADYVWHVGRQGHAEDFKGALQRWWLLLCQGRRQLDGNRTSWCLRAIRVQPAWFQAQVALDGASGALTE